MQFIVPNPNFSVILPGGCNAKCDFCFWEKDKNATIQKFMRGLEKAIKVLPSSFKEVSITGGEPTLSKAFPASAFMLSQRFDKIVLTTNGVNLVECLQDGSIDPVKHINISRHAIDDSLNEGVFKTKRVPGRNDLAKMIALAERYGKDVRLNVVSGEKMYGGERLLDWVKFARSMGVNTISFRTDSELGLDFVHEYERRFIREGRKTTHETGCPVCISRWYSYHGINMAFKYSMTEPTDVGPYEVVLQQDGRMTLDWAGKQEYASSKKPKTVLKPENFSYNNCGSNPRGC